MAGILQTLFRSDDFLDFKEWANHFVADGKLTRQFIHVDAPMPVVVDSSQIIRQILWAARKRRQLDARTDLAEVVDSGLIKAYVPEQLRDEVESKIPVLAAEKGIPEEALRREWLTIQKSLHFEVVSTSEHERGHRDVKDLPFVELAKRVGAVGVLTHDLDIPAMGAKLLPTKTLTKMRDYARATSVAVGSFVALIFWGILVMVLLAPLWRALVWVCKKLGWAGVIITIAVVCLILYLNDDLRKWVSDKFERLGDRIRGGWNVAKPHVNAALEDLVENRIASRQLWSELEVDLDLPKQPTSNVA